MILSHVPLPIGLPEQRHTKANPKAAFTSSLLLHPSSLISVSVLWEGIEPPTS